LRGFSISRGAAKTVKSLWANSVLPTMKYKNNKNTGRNQSMTTNEYAHALLWAKKEPEIIDENAVCEVSQLFSGGFTYLLYEALWMNDFDMDAITQHLESLYGTNNHFGFIYFIFILANAAELTIPDRIQLRKSVKCQEIHR
jgi:hypothetical protein